VIRNQPGVSVRKTVSPCPTRSEMALVQSNHRQFARLGDRRDGDIGEARIPAGCSASIAQWAPDPCCTEIEGQHAVHVNRKDAVSPRRADPVRKSLAMRASISAPVIADR